MKKFLLLPVILALFLVLGAGIRPANATPWNWDLSQVNATATTDGGVTHPSTLHFESFMGVINPTGTLTTVVQDLGADGVLNDGDTFTESGLLAEVNRDGEAVIFNDDPLTKQLHIYFQFDDMTGTVANYSAGSDGVDTDVTNYATALVDDSYDLLFDVGSDITLYIDNDLDPGNGTLATLATSKVTYGLGKSPDFFVGGAAEGQFGVVAGLTSVLPGFWSFDDGTKFEDWMTNYGIPSIFVSSFNLGATFKGVTAVGDDLVFGIFNHGDLELSAVPEPATMLLLGIGLLGFAGLGRKKIFTKKG